MANKKCDHKELKVVVKLLTERGFKVTSTSLEIYDLFLGHPYIDKITHIQIEFGAFYPRPYLRDFLLTG